MRYWKSKKKNIRNNSKTLELKKMCTVLNKFIEIFIFHKKCPIWFINPRLELIQPWQLRQKKVSCPLILCITTHFLSAHTFLQPTFKCRIGFFNIFICNLPPPPLIHHPWSVSHHPSLYILQPSSFSLIEEVGVWHWWNPSCFYIYMV